MERWLTYFANQLTKEERRKLAMKDEKIKNAMDAAQVFLSNKEVRRRYINREMAIMDRRSELVSAKEEGWDKAKLEDIKTIMRKGSLSLEAAMDMLDIPAAEQTKYVGLIQKNLH